MEKGGSWRSEIVTALRSTRKNLSERKKRKKSWSVVKAKKIKTQTTLTNKRIPIDRQDAIKRKNHPERSLHETKKAMSSGTTGTKFINSKFMYSEQLYSIVDIVKKLDIPRERLRDWMNRCSVITNDQEGADQKTKAIFNRIDVYGAALFEYLVMERFFSREDAAKFTKLWIQTMNGEASRSQTAPTEGQKNTHPSNVLIFINISTDAGKDLICEPVGIYGMKESEEGFHFFKALGEILKNKLRDRSWDDFCL
ncbi:MAG: hypothetical protein JRJ85_26205, partial [Deltaproteobacteria bacterium]|nr:hypothetical protein [Deltaproteobacteria bacterium]